ncbi:MAG: beta-N-acetylhexosaminidase [Bacteroidota bacterium]
MKFLFLLLFLPLSVMAQCPVIPAPASYTPRKLQFKFEDTTFVNFGKIPQNVQEHLQSLLLEDCGLTLQQASGRKPRISFQQTDSASHPDFYAIRVSPHYISIDYTSDASCFYAVNSLFQLIEEEDYINSCTLEDYPKFNWRGLHLDVSRHFFTVEEVKRYIDLMAFYKFNTFHWHLTDDQGWRIEIKQFPKLTAVGAWRDSTVNKHYTTVPRTYTVEKYGGFYTQEQVKEVVQYAADRYITVVPEIEMPGHARAALAAYPQLSCTGAQQGVEGLWGVFDDIYCSKKETIDFNKAVLDEVVALFPSPYIHIGGDEAPRERWKSCPDCQRMIQENGLKDEHELQSYFIRQIDAHLASKGKKLIGWDEILEGGLSPNAAVMSWRGFEGGIEAVKQGHAVVMSPGSHCYFDHYQSSAPGQPIAFGGFTPIEKVYEFTPVPPGLTEEQSKLILGGQANLWTEYIPNMKQLEYMVYPRALALSQVLWSVHKPSYQTFHQVLLEKQVGFLEKKDVNFSQSFLNPTFEVLKARKGVKYKFSYPSKKIKFYNYIEYGDMALANEGSFSSKWVFNMNPARIPPGNCKLEIEPNDIDSAQTLIYHFFIHPGLGLSVTYITPPNKRYAGNELTLVDGVIGRLPWNSSEWVGFDTAVIRLEMDLEQTKAVKTLELRFLDDESSWIHLPESMDISISSNGKNWTVFSQEVKAVNQIAINQAARYICFKINTKTRIPDGKPGAGHVPWTFMDEIVLDLK